jgi:hypothetical protein
MQDQVNATPASKRVPWNKGKLTGAKPPLRPKHVWSIGGPRYFAWGRFRDFLSRPCRAPPKGRYAGSGTRDR